MDAFCMPNTKGSTRKVSDHDVIRLNALGYSLQYISEELNCHPTTITLRLKQLGIPPADTRRCFMEDVYQTITPAQLEKLSNKLGPHYSVKDHVRNLLTMDLIKS